MDKKVAVEADNYSLVYKTGACFIGVWFVVWAVVFWQALASAVAVWSTSNIFTHCFFVLPIVAWCIWQQRGAVLAQPVKVSMLGLLAMIVALLVIVVGRAADINVFQHMGVFGLIPVAALTVFGWRVVAQISYPLLLVLFAIPIGEELVPTLQDVTANIAMWFLQVAKVPVYRDALYFTIPNGRFVVAEACSGISFFIACIMIGSAYAYLNFISLWRAAAFVLISIIVPILANGIRVFGIIMIGHKTDMEYAVGADHLVYGGMFFAIIIALLFVIGHFISDGHRQWNNQITSIHNSWFNHFKSKNAVLVLAPLAITGLVFVALNKPGPEQTFNLTGFAQQSVTKQELAAIPWAPRFNGADEYFIGAETVNSIAGNLYTAVYQSDLQGHELISSANRLYDLNGWTLVNQHSLDVNGLGAVSVLDLSSSTGQRRLLAYWYVLPQLTTSSQLRTKLQQALNRVRGLPQGGAVIAVSVSYQGKLEESLRFIEQWLNAQAALQVEQLQLLQ